MNSQSFCLFELGIDWLSCIVWPSVSFGDGGEQKWGRWLYNWAPRTMVRQLMTTCFHAKEKQKENMTGCLRSTWELRSWDNQGQKIFGGYQGHHSQEIMPENIQPPTCHFLINVVIYVWSEYLQNFSRNTSFFLSTTPVLICRKLGGPIPNLRPMEIISVAKSISSESQSACRGTRDGITSFPKASILEMLLMVLIYPHMVLNNFF